MIKNSFIFLSTLCKYLEALKVIKKLLNPPKLTLRGDVTPALKFSMVTPPFFKSRVCSPLTLGGG
jgi:hypothetical protein